MWLESVWKGKHLHSVILQNAFEALPLQSCTKIAMGCHWSSMDNEINSLLLFLMFCCSALTLQIALRGQWENDENRSMTQNQNCQMNSFCLLFLSLERNERIYDYFRMHLIESYHEFSCFVLIFHLKGHSMEQKLCFGPGNQMKSSLELMETYLVV